MVEMGWFCGAEEEVTSNISSEMPNEMFSNEGQIIHKYIVSFFL